MAKFCTVCGTPLEEDKKFCTSCGAPVDTPPQAVPEAAPQIAAEAQPTAPPPPAAPPPVAPPPPVAAEPQRKRGRKKEKAPPVYDPAAPAPGSKYAPITTGGFIGIFLLMCIPLIGLIFMIVWACGGCRKIQKRNLSRAMLIMTAIGLVISLIVGIAGRAVFNRAVAQVEAESGINVSELMGGGSGLGGLLGGGDNRGDSGGEADALGGLGALLEGSGNDDVTNEDIQDLEALGEMLSGLGALTGEDSSGFEGLIDGAIEANQDAEAANDGWPKSLRKYPGGTATAVASYRTEITDTSQEEMMGWIEDLKGDGFTYQDFYDFGMTEEDMLGMGSWWAYDGKTYLSVSYYDGVVTVDHTKELPDLSSYFG